MNRDTCMELKDVAANICCAADVLATLMLAVDHKELTYLEAANAVEWISTCIRAEGKQIENILRQHRTEQ